MGHSSPEVTIAEGWLSDVCWGSSRNLSTGRKFDDLKWGGEETDRELGRKMRWRLLSSDKIMIMDRKKYFSLSRALRRGISTR